MTTTTLEGTARALVAPGKGILAAAASYATISRRFEDGQRAFRHRARCNSAARAGAYTAELERSVR